MKQERIFIGTVLAASIWFVVNPDFHYRTASAERLPSAQAALSADGSQWRNAVAGGAPLHPNLAAKRNLGRLRYENVLVTLAYSNEVCGATVTEAPMGVGSPIALPTGWACEDGAKRIRGAAIYDPLTARLNEFEPNVTPDDAPFERKILARWKNYGSLCPGGACSASELVVLDDGNVQVRTENASTHGTEIGKLTESEIKNLTDTFERIVLTSRIERRIDDPKSTEPVEIALNLNFVENGFVDADFLHASIRFPPIEETKTACAIIEEKTPVHFCDLLTWETVPSPTPSGGPTGRPGDHDPREYWDPRHPHDRPSPRPSVRPSSIPSGTPPPVWRVPPPVLKDPPPKDPLHPPSPKAGEEPPPADEPKDHPRVATGARMMTWGKMNSPTVAAGFTYVSCHGAGSECDAYRGDTSCQSVLPMLCIRKDSAIAKPAFPAELENNQYTRWAGGEVKTLPGISGTRLWSQGEADRLCRTAFGGDWRMAEFHDGWGWGFTAKGNVESNQKFWIWINDQNSNCWNSNP